MLKAVNDSVIIKEVQPIEVTDGGVHLPQLRQLTKRQGTVVSVGPGRVLPDYTVSRMSVKEGDEVIYEPTSGTLIMLGEEKYLVLSEKSIVAIIQEGKNVG